MKAQSLLICRKPRTHEKDDFKTACVKLFKVNNPHTTGALPTNEVEYANVEKVVIKGFTVQDILEGNDLIINDVGEVSVTHSDKTHEVLVEKV
jgi:hypothetical protein